MMIVALIMRPWVMLTRCFDVVCYILADDVLITATGDHMYDNFVKALNATQEYLQEMGAGVAPDKSFNFASHRRARAWLEQTLWSNIGQGIEVIQDFRYLGGHLSASTSLTSSTLTKRIQQALYQLRRLRTCPATPIAKARAIISKVYAGAFYGIEASSISTGELNSIVASVINVLRTKNDSHHADWFFSTNATNDQDLDPYTQMFVRRVMQMRRTIAKSNGSIQLIKYNLRKHVQQQPKPPTWYHSGPGAPKPQSYPAPGTRRGESIIADTHDMTGEAQGPIGLLVASIAWNGLKIDDNIRIWQSREDPIDIVHTPIQTLKKLLLHTGARSRTQAEHSSKRPMLRGLREIDTQASKIHKSFSKEEEGFLKNILSGGKMAPNAISKINEDVDHACPYCHEHAATAEHIRWTCKAFDDVREKTTQR